MGGVPLEVPRVRPALVSPALVRPVHPVALRRPVAQADGRRHSLAALAGIEVDLIRRGLVPDSIEECWLWFWLQEQLEIPF